MNEDIGKRVQKFRNQKGLSLEDVAQRSGLDLSFLKAVEEDGLYPSLGPLLKIARALGLRLGTFLDDRVSQDPLIVRQSERSEQFVTHRGKDAPVDLRYFSLGRGKSDRHMEPFFIEVLPESGKDKSLTSHEGEEFIVVVSGQVELIYGTQTHVLGAGDSLYYNSVVPHHLGCYGDQPASIYAIIYTPE